MSDRYERGFPWVGALAAAAVFLLVVIVFLALTVTKVDAGQVCAVTSGGKVTDIATPGWQLKAPWKKYNCYNARLQVMETIRDLNGDGELDRGDSQAQYVTPEIRGKSIEGLDFDASFVMRYTIDPTPEQVQNMYTVGAKNSDQVNELLVKALARAVIPERMNQHTADYLYLGNLGTLSQEIEDILREELAEDGIVVRDFALKKPNFVDSYETAIADKALKVEETKREEQTQLLAQEQAETLRIQSEGQAAAAVIKSEQEAETSIIAANAEAQRLIIAAESEAQQVELQANAEAEANAVIGASLAANPELLQWEQIQAIRSADVIYLPSDGGVLPIMQIATPEPEE